MKNINKDKLNQVLTLCNDVLQNSGKSLFSDFGDNFQCETQNGVESIWAIQLSHNDGTPKGRINGTDEVSYPMVKEYGCCGYHSPSQNLVNAFRTINGLPDFDNFNKIDISGAARVKAYSIDPRLPHTVAMDSLPYKYKPDFIFDGTTWTHQPESYGRFFALKALQWERRLELSCEGFRAYDLLRWGIMGETLNAYFDGERTRRAHLANAKFSVWRDEYLPIPKSQIDLSQKFV